MSQTQHFSIELSQPVADLIRAKVTSGDFASESEFIEASLLGQLPDQGVAGVEQWLRTTGVDRYNAYEAEPDDVFTEDEVFADIERALAAKAQAG